jgi:hypothetical protein
LDVSFFRLGRKNCGAAKTFGNVLRSGRCFSVSPGKVHRNTQNNPGICTIKKLVYYNILDQSIVAFLVWMSLWCGRGKEKVEISLNEGNWK